MNSKAGRTRIHIKRGMAWLALLCGICVIMLLTGCSDKQAEGEQDAVDAAVGSADVLEEEPVEEENPMASNPHGIDPQKPMIALTFDDGPSKHTWAIVDTLQQYNARATFFELGRLVDSHYDAIEYVLANDNEIGSHSVDHQNLTKLEVADIYNQIRPMDAKMQEQHSYTPALYRVPYGAKNDQVQNVLREEGKPIISWSVDPYDWKVKDKDKIKNHILNSVQDGDIVLMHDIYEPTAAAVAELVPALQERGYQLVTVSELFYFRGETPEPGMEYHHLRRPTQQ